VIVHYEALLILFVYQKFGYINIIPTIK